MSARDPFAHQDSSTYLWYKYSTQNYDCKAQNYDQFVQNFEVIFVDFSQRLKELKREKSCTNKEIGEVSGVSEGAVRYWMSGERIPGADKAVLLAKFFGVSVDYLMGEEEKPADPKIDGLTEEEQAYIEWYRKMATDKDKAIIRTIISGDGNG